MSLAQTFLGKQVSVTMDRPLGSKHPKHNFEYLVNYGYIPGTLAGDGEELDVYVLDVDKPLDTFTGTCIGYIHRTSDDDDKLLVVEDSAKKRTEEEIRKKVDFQEKRFESEIILFDE